MADCIVEKENLGLSKCNQLPGLIRGMITTPQNFKFSAADSVDETKWQDALLNPKASRIYLWPFFVSFEDISEEAQYEETALAYLLVRDGNYRYRAGIKENLCIHKAMYTHRSSQDRVFLIDDQNQIIGTTNDAGDFMGLSLQLLNTEKMKFSDGSVSTKSPIVIALSNNKEFDKDGAILTADFVNTLQRIVDVELTVISASATTIVVDAKVKCDGTMVNGLVLADFLLKTTLGAAQTITSIAENDGRYTLTDTDFADGTLQLRPPLTLSIKAYESNIVTVNVV